MSGCFLSMCALRRCASFLGSMLFCLHCWSRLWKQSGWFWLASSTWNFFFSLLLKLLALTAQHSNPAPKGEELLCIPTNSQQMSMPEKTRTSPSHFRAEALRITLQDLDHMFPKSSGSLFIALRDLICQSSVEMECWWYLKPRQSRPHRTGWCAPRFFAVMWINCWQKPRGVSAESCWCFRFPRPFIEAQGAGPGSRAAWRCRQGWGLTECRLQLACVHGCTVPCFLLAAAPSQMPAGLHYRTEELAVNSGRWLLAGHRWWQR